MRVVDRNGSCHAELVWDRGNTDRLVRLTVDGATVDGAVIDHPLLGPAHAVGDTAMTAVDWAWPTEIPAIAEPARLPLGAGSALLNTLALLARRAGIACLRYAGPYPTAALWRALARSFRCNADEAAFTAGALDRAVRVARDPIPIDFDPDPHERLAIPGGFVELRGGIESPGSAGARSTAKRCGDGGDGIERVVIAGIAYEPGGSPARLIDGAFQDGGPDAGHHCEVWFGDTCYARIATLSTDGTLVAGPHPVPACASPVQGKSFPAALRDALAELVADVVPAPLASDARALCAGSEIRWADLGARAARELSDGFAVHAALWDRIAPLGLARLALALTEALAPVITAAVVRRATAPGDPLRYLHGITQEPR